MSSMSGWRRSRWIMWIVVPLIVLAGLGYGAFQLTMLHFYPDPPEAHYPPPANALEAQRQDLDYFAKLQELDRSYSPAARAQANRVIAIMKAANKALPPQAMPGLVLWLWRRVAGRSPILLAPQRQRLSQAGDLSTACPSTRAPRRVR